MSQKLLSTYDVFGQIYQNVHELSQKEQGTKPVNAEDWLKKNYNPLNHFEVYLKELIQQLEEEKAIEVFREDKAVNFCADQSLIEYLRLIEELIKIHFPTVNKISFFLQHDPETFDKWVSADTEVSGDIDQIIEWEDSFIREWVSQVPYPERNKIRLSCDII